MKEINKEPCELCGRWEYLQTHHIFEGYFLRRQSEKYRLTKRICRFCHEDIHKHPLKYIDLKADTQRDLMQKLGWTMDDWHREFGKNYLEDEQ